MLVESYAQAFREGTGAECRARTRAREQSLKSRRLVRMHSASALAAQRSPRPCSFSNHNPRQALQDTLLSDCSYAASCASPLCSNAPAGLPDNSQLYVIAYRGHHAGWRPTINLERSGNLQKIARMMRTRQCMAPRACIYGYGVYTSRIRLLKSQAPFRRFRPNAREAAAAGASERTFASDREGARVWSRHSQR